jgi:adenylyltransferase/sulfurtransferase
VSKRYARQIALADVGAEGQAKLGRARVLIVGLGGLGCPAALYLGTSGIGRLVLNDFDRVDETNLPRQILYGPDDVGALKVDAAKKRLTSLNPELEVVCVPERLDAAALDAAVGNVDVVLDGTDNFAARFGVNRACVARGVPASKGRSQSFRTEATAPVTRASTTTRTNGSATVRATACSRPCPA